VGIRTIILVAGAGAALMATYDHTVPWGLSRRYDRLESSIPSRTQRAASEAAAHQLALDSGVIAEKWEPALRQCRQELRDRSVAEGERISAANAQQSASRATAYRLGQASCGASNAKKTDPGSPAASNGGVLDDDTDLADVLAGAAYAPGRP